MEPDDTSFADGDTHVVDRDCPICGKRSVTTYLHHDTFTYGSGDTAATLEVVDLPVRRCGACDFEFLDHEGQRLHHAAVCRHLGVLTPEEIRGIRRSFGMSRAAFAELTGIDEGYRVRIRASRGAVAKKRR